MSSTTNFSIAITCPNSDFRLESSVGKDSFNDGEPFVASPRGLVFALLLIRFPDQNRHLSIVTTKIPSGLLANLYLGFTHGLHSTTVPCSKSIGTCHNGCMASDPEMACWSLSSKAPLHARVTLWILGVVIHRPGSPNTGTFSSADGPYKMNPVERAIKKRGHSLGWCGPGDPANSPTLVWESDD